MNKLDIKKRRINVEKRRTRIFAALGAIVLILALFFGYEYYQYKNSLQIENEGFFLISQGKYVEGLQKCLEKPYKVTSCYAFAFVNMLAKNQTIQKEFCESISLDDKVPFWDYKKNCDNLHNFSRNSPIDNCKNYKLINAVIYKEKQADYFEKVKELKIKCYQVYFTKTLGITDIQQAQEYAANNTAI